MWCSSLRGANPAVQGYFRRISTDLGPAGGRWPPVGIISLVAASSGHPVLIRRDDYVVPYDYSAPLTPPRLAASGWPTG